MLLHFDPALPLYVIGKSTAANELFHWLDSEIENKSALKKITVEEYHTLDSGSQCMLGIADFDFRQNFVNESLIKKHRWPVYIHPTATVCSTANLGMGSVIHPCVTIGYQVKLGDFCWITPCCYVGHLTILGENVCVNPGTTITGEVKIGNHVKFGQCCSIKDLITISDNTEFFMNSVVTKNILQPGTYYGNKVVPNQH